jgi:hypothetical protein
MSGKQGLMGKNFLDMKGFGGAIKNLWGGQYYCYDYRSCTWLLGSGLGCPELRTQRQGCCVVLCRRRLLLLIDCRIFAFFLRNPLGGLDGICTSCSYLLSSFFLSRSPLVGLPCTFAVCISLVRLFASLFEDHRNTQKLDGCIGRGEMWIFVPHL